MTDTSFFEQLPRLEWHNQRPFVFARLPVAYARLLEQLALDYEAQVKALPVARGWEELAAENPTGARYTSYNTFLLDDRYFLLFHALQHCYRHLLQQTKTQMGPCYLKSWFNVHRAGERLVRHQHQAPFIGSFCARGEGSTTGYGHSAHSNQDDYQVENIDGQLLVTLGPRHFHEVSLWQDPERARVSYAFDINPARNGPMPSIYIPFDAGTQALTRLPTGADS